MKPNKLADTVSAAKSIAIISHKNPDGDTVGCALALYSVLKDGRSVHVFCEDSLPDKFLTLPYAKIFNAEKPAEKYDLAIAVDCGDEGRLGVMYEVFKSAKITVNIDHHKTNSRYADINLVEPGTAACAMQIYKVCKDFTGGKIPKDTATLLYTALYNDSGAFAFSSVTAETLSVAAELVKTGISPSEIAYAYFRKTAKKVFDLRIRALSKVKFYHDNRVGIMYFQRGDFAATGTDTTDTEGAVNTVLNIDEVEIAVTVADFESNQFKVSVRTKGDIDASELCGIFGGGGHKNAAGCRFFGVYEEVLDKLLKTTKDFLP